MTTPKAVNRPKVIFLLLQVMAVLALMLGALFAVHLGVIGIHVLQGRWYEDAFCTPLNAVIGLLVLVAVSLCACAALVLFIALCQRLKRDTAFTAENVVSLRHIAQSCGLAGIITAGAGAWLWLSGVMPFPLLLLGFLFLALALMAYTLHLLLRQAVEIQQENELTV